jgi:hypothetical protein
VIPVKFLNQGSEKQCVMVEVQMIEDGPKLTDQRRQLESCFCGAAEVNRRLVTGRGVTGEGVGMGVRFLDTWFPNVTDGSSIVTTGE